MTDLFAWASGTSTAEPALLPDTDEIVTALKSLPEAIRAETVWRAWPEVHFPAGVADRLLPPPEDYSTAEARGAISDILADCVSDSGGQRDAMAYRFLIALSKAPELARQELSRFCVQPGACLRAAGITREA